MDYLIDIIRLTFTFLLSIIFIIIVLRLFTKLTEPFYEWLERKQNK